MILLTHSDKRRLLLWCIRRFWRAPAVLLLAMWLTTRWPWFGVGFLPAAVALTFASLALVAFMLLNVGKVCGPWRTPAPLPKHLEADDVLT